MKRRSAEQAVRDAALAASLDDLFAVRDLPPVIERVDEDGFAWHADDCRCPSCYRAGARAVRA